MGNNGRKQSWENDEYFPADPGALVQHAGTKLASKQSGGVRWGWDWTGKGNVQYGSLFV